MKPSNEKPTLEVISTEPIKPPREIHDVDPETLDDNEIMAAGDLMVRTPGLTIEQSFQMTAADNVIVRLDNAKRGKFHKRYMDLTGRELPKAA